MKWDTAASGALVLIQRSTFSNVANTSTTFDSVFTSTYKAYQVVIEELYAATASNDSILEMLFSGSVQTSGYYGASGGGKYDSATFNNIQNNNAAAFTFGNDIGGSGSPTTANFLFSRVGSSSQEPNLIGTVYEAELATARVCGFNLAPQAYTGFRLKSSSSNITGTVAVYGLATA